MRDGFELNGRRGARYGRHFRDWRSSGPRQPQESNPRRGDRREPSQPRILQKERFSVNIRPRCISGWTVSVFGVLAVIMGVLGLIRPDIQFGVIGFELLDMRSPGDYTPAVMATTSLAAVTMGVFYLVGVAMCWPGFIAFTVAARLFMCAGFIVLILAGQAPAAFIGAALWEGLGAATTGTALWWDNRRVSQIVA